MYRETQNLNTAGGPPRHLVRPLLWLVDPPSHDTQYRGNAPAIAPILVPHARTSPSCPNLSSSKVYPGPRLVYITKSSCAVVLLCIFPLP